MTHDMDSLRNDDAHAYVAHLRRDLMLYLHYPSLNKIAKNVLYFRRLWCIQTLRSHKRPILNVPTRYMEIYLSHMN